MEMVMHNVKSGVTVAAKYDKSLHTVDFSIAMCKRSEDTFSRKQGFRTATTRLNRKPQTIYLASNQKSQDYVKSVFHAIRDCTRDVSKRRTQDSVIMSIRRAIRTCYSNLPDANRQLACTDEPCGTGF